MFISKLGKNKGLERSRIWIEGRRLTAHGWNAKQTYFTKSYDDAAAMRSRLLKTSAKP
jgi:hypothetical protein